MGANKAKTRKRLFSFRFSFFPFTVLGMIVLACGIFVYVSHKNYYDSSIDGSELAEEMQNEIPKDVQKKIDEEKLLSQDLSQTVLGTKSDQKYAQPKIVDVPILMYHYVEYVADKNDTKRMSLNTPPFILEDEVKNLVEAGYTFITNQELADVMLGKRLLPNKPVVLTFDDGYRDFYTDAYPILKKYHAKATQYVISGFLNKPNHLLTSQLLEIAQDGLVEIGAHTVHHVWLKGGTLKTVQEEVTQSKQDLEKLIGKAVVSFAYPFGAFDQQALDAVKKAGYLSATSTIPGIEQKQEYKYFMYRLRPGGRTGKEFIAWLETTSKQSKE